MKVTIAQLNPIIGDFRGNIDKAKSAIQQARNEGSKLICFPEMFITGYPPRDLLERHDFIHCSQIALNELIVYAKLLSEITIICGTILPNNKSHGLGLYNAAVVIQNGKLLFSQNKTLLPTYDVFDETRYFDHSEKNLVFEYGKHKIGLTICEDAWYDSEFFKKERYEINPVASLVKKGASIIINLSASPFQAAKQTLRYKLIHSHVIKHQIPFILVNQIGGHDELIFDGHSMVFNAKGHLLELLPGFQEKIVTVDMEEITNIQFEPMDDIEAIYKALITGLKDYLLKCGLKKVVIGLSGGIDSSLVACIARSAIGSENVIGVAMPSMYSSRGSIDDAEQLARNLGITFKIVPIESIYRAYMNLLESDFSGLPVDVTEENIQARIRGNILMSYSNKFHAMTLATGNKSELSVGYCTMYGDMSGGLSVIGDVPKTIVYKLANYVNQDMEIIPKNIILKPPSAELKPDQKDQDTLPPYEKLDAIIDLYIDQMKDYKEIVQAGFDSDTVKWVIRTISKNEYKRRQAAPVLKITSKAYGMGRRMPIAAQYKFAWDH